MAGIEKTVIQTPVVKTPLNTDSPPVAAAPGAAPGAVPTGAPNLRRFAQITGGSTSGARGIWSRPNAGYNGPIEVGRVHFTSTSAAVDQIVKENGADENPALLQLFLDEANA